MDASSLKSKLHQEQFTFGPWTLTAVESHILISEGPNREKFERELKLPQLPEMVFADNVLRLKHASGFGIEFNALDALRLVDAEHDHLKVAVSQAWREAREDCEHINDVAKPFDWTFTTDYTGTLLGEADNRLQVDGSSERIDLERLKVREKIHFFGDIMLYEDELADNGRSVLSVKIRVMPTSFFALMRLYMRVDDVIVRVNDTRIYHQADKDYILREYTSKEAHIKDLKVPIHVLTDANEVSQHLKVVTERNEKLCFPKPVASGVEMTAATLV